MVEKNPHRTHIVELQRLMETNTFYTFRIFYDLTLSYPNDEQTIQRLDVTFYSNASSKNNNNKERRCDRNVRRSNTDCC